MDGWCRDSFNFIPSLHGYRSEEGAIAIAWRLISLMSDYYHLEKMSSEISLWICRKYLGHQKENIWGILSYHIINISSRLSSELKNVDLHIAVGVILEIRPRRSQINWKILTPKTWQPLGMPWEDISVFGFYWQALAFKFEYMFCRQHWFKGMLRWNEKC